MINWEPLKSNNAEFMSRAKVPGGWLVKMVFDVLTTVSYESPNDIQSDKQWRGSITFYPDPKHQWDGTSLNN